MDAKTPFGLPSVSTEGCILSCCCVNAKKPCVCATDISSTRGRWHWCNCGFHARKPRFPILNSPGVPSKTQAGGSPGLASLLKNSMMVCLCSGNLISGNTSPSGPRQVPRGPEESTTDNQSQPSAGLRRARRDGVAEGSHEVLDPLGIPRWYS